MPTGRRATERNLLLRALSRADEARLRPALERVSLGSGVVLDDARTPITHVYFPQRCVVSALMSVEPGRVMAVHTVGNEGLVGLALLLGERAGTRPRMVVQVPDDAERVSAAVFARAVQRSTSLRALLLHYTAVVLREAWRAAACAHLHALDRRCARWLLATQDRVGADAFRLTQEFLARMLGVRRPSVSLAAGSLQRAGLITYARGRITIADRTGLEAAACTCYRLARADGARLLP